MPFPCNGILLILGNFPRIFPMSTLRQIPADIDKCPLPFRTDKFDKFDKNIHKSEGYLNTGPFNNRTGFNHLNTGLVHYLDPHCTTK